MKFMDVVQNGVLQAYQKRIDRHDRLITPERRKRLLKYKGDRVVRSMKRSSGKLHIIFD